MYKTPPGGGGGSIASSRSTRNVDQSEVQILLHSKNIHRIYGRIAGNQLPGHVLLFFTGTRKNYLAWQDRKEQGSVT